MQYDITIVGAGIVGLASAYKILERRPETRLLILEKEAGVAMHQTGNNSGVIHSGIYYRPGSLRALNCISGYRQLLEFSDREGIPYQLCGKIIVATDERERAILATVLERGLQNGLKKIRTLSAGEMKEKEPYVCGLEAVEVPYTGIIDFRKVAGKLADIVSRRQGVGEGLAIGQLGLHMPHDTGATVGIDRKTAQGDQQTVDKAWGVATEQRQWIDPQGHLHREGDQ